jgi:hypothetical protein
MPTKLQTNHYPAFLILLESAGLTGLTGYAPHSPPVTISFELHWTLIVWSYILPLVTINDKIRKRGLDQIATLKTTVVCLAIGLTSPLYLLISFTVLQKRIPVYAYNLNFSGFASMSLLFLLLLSFQIQLRTSGALSLKFYRCCQMLYILARSQRIKNRYTPAQCFPNGSEGNIYNRNCRVWKIAPYI